VVDADRAARLARTARADVLHHPLPALAVRAPCPQVVTVHDLAFERLPELFSPGFRRWASRAHRRAARGAGAVVCVSQTTRRDARARWGLDDARIVVAPHGPGQPLAVTRTEPPEHFLYIGDDEPRKNLALLLDAYGRYRATAGPRPLALVLAGRASSDREGVRCEREPDIAALLGAAAALVHPALHEGFGLTALEAMAAAVAVIAARSPGLAETCGEAVRYIDPYDATDLAAALGEIATDGALRAGLAARGAARAASSPGRLRRERTSRPIPSRPVAHPVTDHPNLRAPITGRRRPRASMCQRHTFAPASLPAGAGIRIFRCPATGRTTRHEGCDPRHTRHPRVL